MGFSLGKLGNILGGVLSVVGSLIAMFGGPYAPWGYAMIIAGGALTMATADAWEQKPGSPSMGGHRMNVRSSRQPVKLIYGEVEIGVNKTFYHSSNPYLHIICEIGEGTLYGIKRQDGTYYTTTATELPTDNPPLIYLDEKLWTEYGGNVYMEWFNGSSDQSICSTLATASGEKWDQYLPYTSYLYIRLLFNWDYFKKEPDVTVVMRGLVVYNPGSEELITNGNMELDSNWSNIGTPTVNERSAVQAHLETYSRKFTVDAQTQGIVSDCFSVMPGDTYGWSAWVYPVGCSSISVIVSEGDGTGNADTTTEAVIQDQWNFISGSYIEPTGGAFSQIAFFSPIGVSSGSWYIDDVKLAPDISWSDNPAMQAYDLITRSSQRGGLGVSTTKIDFDTVETSRDYCISKGWKCNYPIVEQRPVADNLEQILGCFRGTIIYSDGKFKILFMDYNHESVSMALTESDVVSGSLTISMPDISDRYNAVRITYLDSLKNYKPNDYVFSSETAIASDGDFRELAITIYGLTDINLVQKMAYYFLERSRLKKLISFVAGERTKALEPNDLITLTHSMPGWTTNLMRVQSVTINHDDTVSISCIDEDPDLYDDVYNVGDTNYFDTTLFSPTAPPPEVVSVTLTETVYDFRLRTQSRLDISFTPPANYPWFEHVEVWVSQDDTNWNHQLNAKESFSIDPVEELKTYYIKLISVNVFGTHADFDSASKYSKLIDGKSDTAPTSLGDLIAILTGTALNIYADRLTDESDVEVYEFRLGASWTGGVFLSALRSPNLSLNGVKPGAHTIWANVLGTNGLYGDTPKSVSVVVPDPPRGWTALSTFTASTAGTCFDSTVYTYNSSNYIKVNHSSALVGRYESTIFDNSVSKQLLAYIQADYTVIGTGSLWSDLLLTTATLWSDVLSTGRTWADAFSPSEAPQISMKLNYGETTELGTTLERLEILSGVVTGRYFKSVISITDPQPSIYGIVQLPVLKLAT